MSKTDKRVIVHERLKKIMDNVYYQQGDIADMKYPCIIYYRRPPENLKANNRVYLSFDEYTITFIERRDTLKYQEMYDHFTYVDVNRFYVEDGMYHKVIDIKI